MEVCGRYRLPWKEEFWHNVSKYLLQHFPNPSNAAHKIRSRLANLPQRYSSLKVDKVEYGDDFMSVQIIYKSHKDPIIIEMAMLWIRSNMASEIFKFESVDNGRRRRLMKTDVDGRTADHRLKWANNTIKAFSYVHSYCQATLYSKIGNLVASPIHRVV